MSGQLIAGCYQIESELGAGGMGTVYRGIDTQTQQPVAIKQLKSEVAKQENIERFKREGEALRDLNHPNIVKMLNAVEDNNRHYLIMEYISGGDLANLIKQGELPLEKILALAIDLADALTRAHKLGIIHRDLKPANVLIGDDGVLRLTDFGIAHVGSKERVTDTDAIIGTIDYLPPEAFNQQGYDARGDIWAFGVMLFEMLTGERPFGGDTLMLAIQSILTDPIPDLEDARPDCPISLVDLVYRMLERDVQARIASVRHVGAALEDITEGRENHYQKRFETEPVATPQRPKHNLPTEMTAFVGREAELRELARLLDVPDNRLVTIVASGGMGKTRLSIETARQQLSYFENGVYFVELAPLTDNKNIVAAIAKATGIEISTGDRSELQQLVTVLQHQHLLIIMDNFEHLLDGAPLITEILQHTNYVKFLVTSRQRLNQSGEVLFNLAGMDFPDWETPDDALEYSAVKLFMQSARRVQPDFELHENDLNAVARICKLVRGMPLAILLAASWLEMLTLDEIASEISKNIDFLETEMTDIPERQRSIRAIFDYSWQLMNEKEQAVLAKLSIFRGGFTREAAQAITGATLRNLMHIVSKSLLQRDKETGRYEIHELLRQYAEEALTETGQVDDIYEVHMRYYMDLFAQQDDRFKSNEQIEALDLMETEIDNFSIAWKQACDHHEEALLFAAFHPFFCIFYWRPDVSRETELVRYTINSFKEVVGQNERIWALLLMEYRDQHSNLFGDWVDNRHDFILSTAKKHQDKLMEGLYYIKEFEYSHMMWNEIPWEEYTKTMHTIFRELGDDYWLARALAVGHFYEDTVFEALEIGERIGNKLDTIAQYLGLGWHYAFNIGEWEKGMHYGERGYKLAKELNLVRSLTFGALLMGMKALMNGNLDRTRQYAEELFSLADKDLSDMTTIQPTALLIQIHLMQGDYQQALDYAQQMQGAAYTTDGHALSKALLAMVLMVMNRTDEAVVLAYDFLNGRIGIAKILTYFTYIFHYAHIGADYKAVRLSRICHDLSIPVHFNNWQPLTDLQNTLRKKMGEDAYQDAWAAGESVHFEDAAAELLEEFKPE